MPIVEPRPVSEEDLRSSEPKPSGATAGWTAGCLTYLVLFFIVAAVREVGPPSIVIVIFVFGGLFSAVLGSLVATWSAQEQLRQWRRTELAARTAKAQQEAAAVTQNAERLQSEAETLVHQLHLYLNSATDDLKAAEQEFNERAFGPFWERIAAAAEALANYNYELARLVEVGARYRSLLSGQVHYFPERLHATEIAPHPHQCLERLRTLARAGQKDFEFAVIWEHHRTRRVLVQGFSTLESTLRNVATSIESAVHNAATEIVGLFESSTQDVVKAVDRTRDELSEQIRKGRS